jgi:hypothetical protein
MIQTVKLERKDKLKGIIAGVVCFLLFMIPYMIISFFGAAILGINSINFIYFFVGILTITIISSFFGLSMASKSKILKIISSICVLAMAIIWMLLWNFT